MCRKESAAWMSDVWVVYYWGSLNTSGDNHNLTLLPEIVNCVGGLETCLSSMLVVGEYGGVSSMAFPPSSLSCISKMMPQRLSHIFYSRFCQLFGYSDLTPAACVWFMTSQHFSYQNLAFEEAKAVPS